MTPAEIRQVAEDSDDFAFEMRVARMLSDFSQRPSNLNPIKLHKIEHGGTYTDPITDKLRQFDIRCRIEAQSPDNCAVLRAISLAIECKNVDLDSPLVICGRPRMANEAYYWFLDASYSEEGTIHENISRTRTGPLYKEKEFVGKSLFRIKKSEPGTRSPKKLEPDPNSDIYDRWSQAVASCLELANQAFSRRVPFTRVTTLVLPLVVVPDDALWIVRYEQDGSQHEDPSRVEDCEFFIGRNVLLRRRSFGFTHIHFLTLTGLKYFLENFWVHTSTMDWIFPDDSSDVMPIVAAE